METNFGFKKSVIDGSENIFGVSKSIDIPSSYTYRPYLPTVIDQGSLSICVPCSISAFLNWKENLKEGETKDNKIALMEIYNSRTNKGDGMTFKDAFHFLRHTGVNSKAGILTINSYALVTNIRSLREAIVSNGPCVGALPVYNDNPEFWKKNDGDSLLGYHAISLMGYDENGIFIRNSWGSHFADGGYTYIKNEDFGKLLEVWTVVE